MRKVAYALIGFAVVLMLWYLGVAYVQITRADLSQEVVRRLYPLPQQVLRAAWELDWREVVAAAALSSWRVLCGFVAAAVVALVLGFSIGRLPFVARALEPANDFLRYLPVAGFGSLTIFLLGTGDVSAVVVVFIGTVFHLVVATADAVRRVPGAYLQLARTLNYNPLQRLWKIIVPASAPSVFDSLRVAVGWAWSYVTLAEIMGTEQGLGHAIEVSRRYIRTDQVLVWLCIVGVLGLTSDQLMRWFAAWRYRWAQEVK